MESLSKGLAQLDLTPKGIAFAPNESHYEWGITLDPIPRYLFRVYDSTSPGESNNIWVKSRNATRGQPDARVDIFKRSDRNQGARRIWQHLKWKGCTDDNLMSWTSSVLFAIQYMFRRHNTQWGRPSYADIKMCVLDTQGIARGAFIRDIDLAQAFAPFYYELEDFANFRSRGNYFGEYLSQGALKIEGHNTVVSAQEMIDKGLLLLRPEFDISYEKPDCGWAEPVLAMYDLLEREQCERR